MCRWMLANLAHGTLDGRRFLREETHDTMWHPTIKTGGDDPLSEISCLGWFRGIYLEQPVVYHGGSDPGFWADLSLLPERQMGLIALSNVYCSTGWAVTNAAMEIMLGLEPTMPKRPVTVPVGAVLQRDGQDAAIAEYRRLQREAGDEYDFADHLLSDAALSAVWVHRPNAVMPLLHLWAALFPESSEPFEELGRAYLMSGDVAAAERSLQQALALEPESQSIARLIRSTRCAATDG